MTHFFPPKALQLQKSYLLRGLFKPRYSKIFNLIYHTNNIVYYLYHFLSFRISQGFHDNKLINIIKFTLPYKPHKQLLMKGSDSAIKSLNKISELCKLLDTEGQILHDKIDGTNPNKKANHQSASHQSASPDKAKKVKPDR